MNSIVQISNNSREILRPLRCSILYHQFVNRLLDCAIQSFYCSVCLRGVGQTETMMNSQLLQKCIKGVCFEFESVITLNNFGRMWKRSKQSIQKGQEMIFVSNRCRPYEFAESIHHYKHESWPSVGKFSNIKLEH